MSTLFIVSTPIGNLEDITLRALRTLKEADLVLCEDTRRTKILLERYDIHTLTISYHQHSKISKIEYILELLKSGKNIALVSDAGTPAISDPGGVLVERALEVSNVVPIPGPSALTAALSVSGIPTDKFTFLGYLPHKKGRKTLYQEIANSPYATIFFESTHRILKSLEALAGILTPERHLVVCRELTKQFESIYRGNVLEVLQQLKNDSLKGEFTVLVAPPLYKKKKNS